MILLISQMTLVAQIISAVEAQALKQGVPKGSLVASSRQFNAICSAATAITKALETEDVRATPGMGLRAWLASDDELGDGGTLYRRISELTK